LRILLTNDDGIYADGLQALREVLQRSPGLQVWVVAPDRERSASSHAITLHKPLYVNEVKLPGATVPMWSINGTPADCTKIGVCALLPERPDLVISGINRGYNLGTDVLYSGTVSAAIEGVILGIPSIAVSLAAEHADYSFAAQFVEHLVQTFRRRGISARETLLNINIPALDAEHIAGVAVTSLSHRRYENTFIRRVDPRGRAYYWMAGELLTLDHDEDTDVGALSRNMVSLTPLHLDLTHRPMQEELKEWLPDLNQLVTGDSSPQAT